MTNATAFTLGFVTGTITWIAMGLTGYWLSRWAERKSIARRSQGRVKTTVTAPNPIIKPTAAIQTRVISETPFVMMLQ